MKFDKELAQLEEAERIREEAEASIDRRARPVIDAMLRVGRKKDAERFALRLPSCVTKAFILDHVRYGKPAP